MAERRADPSPEEDRTVGELVFDVSERVSILVREEIELAKAEVTEKLTQIAKAAAVGAAAGIFVLGAALLLLDAGAWLINDILGIESAIWAGFAIFAALLLALAVVAGLLAYRWMQRSAPPTPQMAIEEAKLTRETLGGEG